MRVIFKDDLFVIIPETEEENNGFVEWIDAHNNHIFVLENQKYYAIRLKDVSDVYEASNVPINVTSKSRDEHIRLISNFAHTPFWIDKVEYASVEAFWQGLKFSD